MIDRGEIRQELKDRIGEIQASAEEPIIVLRGLHRLYFEHKPEATEAERTHLLVTTFDYRNDNGIDRETEQEIMREEREAASAKERK